MGKIGIIIQREFNERVRKRTFIITTILTPLLMVGIMFAPVLLMHFKSGGVKDIVVSSPGDSRVVAEKLENNEFIRYTVTDEDLNTIKEHRDTRYNDIFGILVLGEDIMSNPKNAKLYTYQSSTVELESSIAQQLENVIENERLKEFEIENLQDILDEVKTSVSLKAYRVEESGEIKESSSILSMGLAFVFGAMIYFFVFLYGGMVMQGVIEEKSSKVLEIMVSSVKPFQLMMGKILGIAAVAITQFMIWLVLIFVLGSVLMQVFAADLVASAGNMMPDASVMTGQMGMDGIDSETVAAIRNITDGAYLMRILGGFLIYFIGGYLLYAAMFAAIGSAVDNVADSQQLQLPVTIPMILAFLVLINVMKEPHSSLALWFSMIPFTSPIIMVARIPYGVPMWEIFLSVALLYLTFILFVWLAGKIYRVGIFMTGKKPTFKEIMKWVRYKY